MLNTTFPRMFRWSTMPTDWNRLSVEWPRLSPRTNTQPSGTVWGNSSTWPGTSGTKVMPRPQCQRQSRAAPPHQPDLPQHGVKVHGLSLCGHHPLDDGLLQRVDDNDHVALLGRARPGLSLAPGRRCGRWGSMERPSTVMTRARKVNTTATSTTAMTMVSVQSSTERAKGCRPGAFHFGGVLSPPRRPPSFPNLEIYGYTGPGSGRGTGGTRLSPRCSVRQSCPRPGSGCPRRQPVVPQDKHAALGHGLGELQQLEGAERLRRDAPFSRPN